MCTVKRSCHRRTLAQKQGQMRKWRKVSRWKMGKINQINFISEKNDTSIERRLALGAFLICMIEWMYTPYTAYISIIPTFMTNDWERHWLIVLLCFSLFTVSTPFTLFLTSPT